MTVIIWINSLYSTSLLLLLGWFVQQASIFTLHPLTISTTAAIYKLQNLFNQSYHATSLGARDKHEHAYQLPGCKKLGSCVGHYVTGIKLYRQMALMKQNV